MNDNDLSGSIPKSLGKQGLNPKVDRGISCACCYMSKEVNQNVDTFLYYCIFLLQTFGT
jgi:hypothetical protein